MIRVTRFASSAACVMLAGYSAPLFAQAQGAPDRSVQDIVVTAQRRSQSLLTVPLAISAFPGTALESKGIQHSTDLSRAVPNLQVNSAFGDTEPNFSLRGISVANEYNSNQASPIGVYVDDVYLANRAAHGTGLFDLDRVEVLRGPQGTLFGRNTTGGAINFITRQPSLSGDNGYLEAGYGNYDTYRVQGAVETTMVEDQLGFRIAGNYEKGDGKFQNVFPGAPDLGSINMLQGRATLRIKPDNGPLDIKIRAYGSRTKGTQQAVYGPGIFRQGLGFFQVDENRVGINRTSAWGVSANVGYQIAPDLRFTSITSYDGGTLTIPGSADGAPIDILVLPWHSSFRQFSEEARLNYDTGRLKLVGGLFYGWDRTVTDNTFDIAGSVPTPAGPMDGGFTQSYTQVRRSYAAFAQGDYNITSKLVLTLGLRYTADRSHYDDGSAYLFLGTVDGPHIPLATTVPCDGPAGTCPYDPNARFNLAGRNNALTGRAALSYTFDNGMLVYASYNRGYRSGTFNGGGYTSSAGISYIKPEYVNAYEAGLKGRFLDRKLTLALAGFYYDYKNQQLQDTKPGPVSILINAPKSQVYGGEAEASFRASPALTLNASIGYLHATYKKLSLDNTNLSGNDLPFAPHWTLQGGFDWTVAHIADGALLLSPSVVYYSHQYFSPYNLIDAPGAGQDNAELQQGAYAKVNMSVSWTKGRLTLRAWADNLLQRKTLVYGLDLRQAGFPYNYLVPAEPRTYGGSVRVAF
jgi:outer membrane receptor protein involved in Fe transport